MNLIGNHIAIAYDSTLNYAKKKTTKTKRINKRIQTMKSDIDVQSIYSSFIFKNENSVN